MDWNTNLDYGSGVDIAPGVNSLLDAHAVDTPGHGNQNQGGSIVIRTYLSPAATCSGLWGTTLDCPAPATATPFGPFIMIRDSSTGCPYYASYLTTVNPINNQPMVWTGGPLNCSDYPVGCLAVVSTSDLSVCPPGDTCTPGSVWLDPTQQTQHTLANSITPQAAYADGHPSSTPTPQYPNNVAWTRSPQWNGTPGPDDSYIGGSLSTTDLANLGSGSACGASPQYGCVARLRFKLPANTPGTPCADTPPNNAGCWLSSNAAMRYWSLTLWQQQPTTFPLDYYNLDPDGIAPNQDGAKAVSIISLADSAFTVTNGYVTLLIVPGANIPTALQQTSASTGISTGGVQPETVSGMYSAWVANGYNVVSLHPFKGTTFDQDVPLMMTLRNTLPASSFNCSGSAVPFFTAEYTSGGGMMGPYLPQVDFVDPTTLTSPPTASGLPPASVCGKIPNLLPSGNGPLYLSAATADCGAGSNCVDWPGQTWAEDNAASPVSPPLVCCSTTPAGSPQIDFVATQFSVPVDANNLTLYPASLQDCYEAFSGQASPCSQVVYQSLQYTGVPSGSPPPNPVTIVGSGFGYLPNLPQVIASCGAGGPCSSAYLEVQNDGHSGLHSSWDTYSNATYCQIYIASWSDTAISIIANLPVSTSDMYSGATLSPLSDVSPLTLMPNAQNTFMCPVEYGSSEGDDLTFIVTNPQSGLSATIPWSVSAPGTSLN